MAGGMSRILGIGFLVGAKDEGATETFEEVTTSSDKMADSIERVGTDSPKSLDKLQTSLDNLSGQMGTLTGVMERAATQGFERLTQEQRDAARAADELGRKDASINRFKAALEALSFLRLGHIADTLDSIAEAAGVGVGAQSTALESFGAQFGQTYRQATAGMGRFQGLVDDVRGQVSSVAFNLQIGAEQMLQPITQLASQGRRLEDFGISVRQLGGAIQGGIIDAATFGQGLTELTNTYGMSEAEAGGLLDRITAIGEQFGIGRAAVAAFPQALEAIRPIAARFPEIEQNAGAAVESMIRLGAAIQSATGTDAQAAMATSAQIMTQLGEARGGLQDLITGLGSDMPEAITELGIASGSIDEAISMAMQDPARFAMQAAAAMRRLGDTSPLGMRFATVLNNISPGLLQLARSSSVSDQALQAMVQPLGDVTGAFGNMATAASGSTRTFQEQLDLMRDAFTTRLNAIGRATDRNFLPRQARAYREVGNTIARFAADKGPLGALTRGFLRVRTFGLVQGLLPQLGVLTDGLGDSVAAMAPFIGVMRDAGLITAIRNLTKGGGFLATVLGGLGTAFTSVILPIGLAAGAIYLLYRYGDRLPDLFERISAALQRASEWFAGIGVRFSTWVDSIDWTQLGRDIADSLGSSIAAAVDWIMTGETGNTILLNFYDGFRNIFSSLGQMIYGLASGIWERWAAGMESGGGTGFFLTYLRSIWIDPMRRTIRVVWSLVSGLGRVLGTIFGNVWERVSGLFSGLSRVFGGGNDAASWFDTLTANINAASGALNWLVGVFEVAMDTVATVLSPVYDALLDFLLTPIDDLIATLQQNGPAFRMIWEDFSRTLADLGAVFGEVGAIVWDFWDGSMAPVIDAWWAAWERLTGDTEESSTLSFRRIGTIATWLWGHIRHGLHGMVGDFRRAFTWIVQNGTEAWRTLTVGAYTMSRRVEGFIERVRVAWEGVQNILRGGWGVVVSETRRAIGGIVIHIENIFGALFTAWERMVLNLKMTLLDTASAILTALNDIIGRIPAAILPEPLRQAQTGLRTALTAVTDEATRHREQMARRMAQIAEDERQRQERSTQALLSMDQEVARSHATLQAAQAQAVANYARAVGREEHDIRAVTEAVDAQVNAIREGAITADRALRSLDEQLQSETTTGARQQRARVRAAEGLLNEEAVQTMLGRVSATQRRDIEAAIAARGTGTGEALTRADIRNLARWAETVPEGGAARERGVGALVNMISGEQEITAPPREVRPETPRRGGRTRAAVERVVETQSPPRGPLDVNIRSVDPSLQGGVEVPATPGNAGGGRRLADIGAGE